MPQLEDGRPRGVVVCAGGRQQVHEHQAGPADREATEGHCQEGGWQVSHPQAFELQLSTDVLRMSTLEYG